LSFFAQIAALTAAVIQIVGFFFVFFEFFYVKIVRRVKGEGSNNVEMGPIDSEISDVEQMKRTIDELMHWKNATQVPHENVTKVTPRDNPVTITNPNPNDTTIRSSLNVDNVRHSAIVPVENGENFSSIHVQTEEFPTPVPTPRDISVLEVTGQEKEIN